MPKEVAKQMGVLIFAKHPGCDKEYLFKVPDELHTPHKGDVLLVRTIRGFQIAVASSEFFESPNADEVATHFPGAYLPLKTVVQVAGPELVAYIKKEVYREVIEAFKKRPAENPSVPEGAEDLPY